mmetsp:Transcript_45881/g.98331  ORF Transcript_45881/g.98331 Transcript_45881/m.98331 type:complete len:765 (+) Transcript_45881:153-2447(+)
MTTVYGKSLKTTSSYSIDFNPERKKLEKDIANHEKRARNVLRQAALANSDKLLDREVLKEIIIESQQRWTGCLMLPVTILFFTFYSVAASLHQDVVTSHLLEAPVRDQLAPPLDDDEEPSAGMLQAVNSIPEAYNFIESTFLPLFLSQQDQFGNTLDVSDFGTFLQYNQLKGLVIFELQRSVKEKCEDSVAKNLWCYPDDTLTSEAFGRDISELSGGTEEYYTEGEEPILECIDEGFTVAGCDERRRLNMLRDDLSPKVPSLPKDEDELAAVTYRFTFSPNSTWEKNLARFNYLKERGFLDDQSTLLTMKAYYLNYQMQVPRMQTVKIVLGFTRGGGLLNTISFMSIALDSFIYTAGIVFDILFVLMLIASAGFLCHNLFKANVAGNIWSHFSFVNLVSWASVFLGLFVVFLMLSTGTLRGAVRDAIVAYQEDPSTENSLALADEVDSASSFLSFVFVVVADAHLLFMIRCFTSLKWQPRLAVVTRTINKMSSDLTHFLIVLIPTFIAFAIAGMMMFGRRLQDWATMQAAMATCFRISMENEFKWKDLSAVDFFTSLLWVWVFVPLVVLLMLNMVLAIIMDIYQEVRREAGNTMTITKHLQYLYMAISKRQEWVTYDALYEGVSALPATISLLELRQAFPTMPDYQGEYLVSECFNKARYISRCGVDTSVTAGMVAAIHVSLEEMLNDINAMKSRGWLGMGFEIPNSSERECVKDILTSVSMQQHWMKLAQSSMNSLKNKIDGVEEDPALPEKSSSKKDVKPGA